MPKLLGRSRVSARALMVSVRHADRRVVRLVAPPLTGYRMSGVELRLTAYREARPPGLNWYPCLEHQHLEHYPRV